ncbi:MAG: DsbA family protein [Bdellovibrionales bacterium]
MKAQRPKNSERSEAKFNRIFLIVSVGIALIIFGKVAYHEYKHGADYSINLSAVDSALLVRPHSPVRGSISAKVTIVEFLDLECKSCRFMHSVLKRLGSEFGSEIQVVIRYLPLHPNSRFAASALEEAREINKYEEALDVLFDNQANWGNHKSPRPELIPEYLSQIGLGKDRTSKEQVISKHQWKIDLDETDARKIGIAKTPTFFVNGRLVKSSYESIRKAIEANLNGK